MSFFAAPVLSLNDDDDNHDAYEVVRRIREMQSCVLGPGVSSMFAGPILWHVQWQHEDEAE